MWVIDASPPLLHDLVKIGGNVAKLAAQNKSGQ
jgi:hypothetical protein